MSTHGVVYIHSSPAALCPHVEWALAAVLGVRVSLSWSAQPASAGALRADCGWRGRPGTAGRLAAALKPWSMLRFEVTEEPSPGCDGERYSHSPGLGLFRAVISANGDVLVSEGRLRALLTGSVHGPAAREPAPPGPASAVLAHGLEQLLGTAWDADLEPYREAGDGSTVTWLHEVV